jgi:hypothetical protein
VKGGRPGLGGGGSLSLWTKSGALHGKALFDRALASRALQKSRRKEVRLLFLVPSGRAAA